MNNLTGLLFAVFPFLRHLKADMEHLRMGKRIRRLSDALGCSAHDFSQATQRAMTLHGSLGHIARTSRTEEEIIQMAIDWAERHLELVRTQLPANDHKPQR